MDKDIFNFDKLLEGNHDTSFVEEDEDTDYDALNSETFGENLPSTDWEEEHAKLAASELERNATNHLGAIPKTTSLKRVPSLWNVSGITDEEIKADYGNPPAQLQHSMPPSTQLNVATLSQSPSRVWALTNEDKEELEQKYMDSLKAFENATNHSGAIPKTTLLKNGRSVWKICGITDEDIKTDITLGRMLMSPTDPWRETNTQNNEDILPNGQISTSLPDPWRETNTPQNQEPNGQISTSLPDPWRETNTQNKQNILPNGQISTSLPDPWRETKNQDLLPNGQISTSRPSKKPINEMQYSRNQPRRNPQHVNNQRGRFRHPNSLNEGYHRVPPPHSYYNPAFVDNRPHQRNYGLPAPPRHHHPGVLLPHPATTMYPRHMKNPQHMRPQRAEHPCDPYYGQASGFSRPGTSNPAHHDEYAGLMSSQEKQWLANIQMMQLNSHQPYKDDYYYTMYQHKQQGNSGRKFGNHGHKNNRDVPATNKPASTYIPLQFENSLGKLQIGSVTAPRKIIDMDLVENVESSVRQSERKTKQILLETEELLNKLLLMEETFIPMAQIAASELSGLEDKIMNMLLTNGKLGAFMSIRKGKKTILRTLPLLTNPSTIVHKLLEDLEGITKKDQDQLLLSFLPAIRSYLSSVTLETLVTLTANYQTKFLLSSKFTVSVIANMVERAGIYLTFNQNEDKTAEEGWKQFWLRLLESVVHWKEADRPVVAMDPDLFKLQANPFTPVGRIHNSKKIKLMMALCNVF